jgi:hypothetical protein
VNAGSARASGPAEILVVWLLFAVVAVEILVTYSRLPARELYHVSGSGLGGGASRALVFLDFPAALVAIAVLALLAGLIATRTAVVVATAGVALCLPVFWPGVVDQANLDAKPINAAPAAGVLLAVALSLAAWRGRRRLSGAQPGDRARVVVAVAALFVGLPWLAADLGLFLNGVPGLDRLFQTGAYRGPSPGLPPFPPAVHHGHHHGMDGTLLLLSALLLSRVVPSLPAHRLRVAVGAYLALMAAYGIGNIANDFWIEQVVKRGWTTWMVPNVLRPSLTVAWGLIALGAVAIFALAAWWTRRAAREAAPRAEPVSHV